MNGFPIRRMRIDELKDFYSRIESDFAPDEYAPYEVLLSQLMDGTQEGLVFRPEGIDCAYAICTVDRKNGYALISLFAVYEGSREKGVGQAFMRALHERYAGLRGIIAEVEKPECASDPADRVSRERRISFYNKLGYVQIPGIGYMIWDVPMHLMVRPLCATEEEIFRRIKEIMHGLYHPLLGERFMHKLILETAVSPLIAVGETAV